MALAKAKGPFAQPFAIHELELALALNDSLPFRGTIVTVVTDNEVVPESIEITPARLDEPEWFMCKCGVTGDIVLGALRRYGLGKRQIEFAAFDCMEDALAAVRVKLIEGI
jgi:hypothetical protein